MQEDYSTVTEVVGDRASLEQLQRMYTRYRFAANLCRGKKALEVACGSGQGLGYLAKTATTVTGVDIDDKLLALAREYYRDRKNIELQQADAQNLPFGENIFEVVILYEAIYYIPDAARFIKEAHRILKKGGVLIICSTNRELPDFNPSPYSHRYYTAMELEKLLQQQGFGDIELFGDSHIEKKSWKSALHSLLKKIAVRLRLMPKTMKGKELLKRIFYGKLVLLPPEITDGLVEYIEPGKIKKNLPVMDYRVIFSLGYKQ